MLKFLSSICSPGGNALKSGIARAYAGIASNRRHIYSVSTAAAGIASATMLIGLGAQAQADTTASTNAAASATVQAPANSPSYLRPAYDKSLRAPRPNVKQSDNPPAVFGSQTYANAHGAEGIYQLGGSVTTANNAFFQVLGTNGRSCASCHKPANGMGVSAAAVQQLFATTAGQDPIFAPVDGSNCPSNVPAANTSAALIGGSFGGGLNSFLGAHSLILNKGLFRIFLPVPTQTNDLSSVGSPAHPTEFTISVVSGPNGCNTDTAAPWCPV